MKMRFFPSATGIAFLFPAIILFIYTAPVASQGGCTISGYPEGGVLFMAEEEIVDYQAFNFNVTPPDATVKWECDDEVGPSPLDQCYYFKLSSDTNSIVVKKEVDIEAEVFRGLLNDGDIPTLLFRDNKKLTCTPAGEGTQVNDTVEIVTIISNVNEYTPKPTQNTVNYNISLFELTLPGTRFEYDEFQPAFEVEDEDVQEEFKCDRYQLVNKSIPFEVECETVHVGNDINHARISLIVADPPPQLDFEIQEDFSFNISIEDQAGVFGNINTGYIPVVVHILDLDDRNPIFECDNYTAHVDEDYQGIVDVLPKNISARDGDTLNTPVLYDIDDDSPACAENIKIDSNTGAVSIVGPLTFLSFCELIVKATEIYNSDRVATTSLTISVDDVNNNCPYFQEPSYTGQLEPGDEYVLQEGSTDQKLLITAIDSDEKFNGTFSENSDTFDIEEIGNGQVQVKVVDPISVVDGATITFNLTVVDRSTGLCNNNVTEVTVKVTNLSPIFTDTDPVAYVEENSTPGTPVTQVSATNADGGTDDLFYEIITSSETFEIEENSGHIKVKSNTIDAEGDITQYVLVVEAQDRRDLSKIRVARTSVTIKVNDMNDSPPSFSKTLYNASIPENWPSFAPFISVQATDPDESSYLVYSLVGDVEQFEIDQSGTIVSTNTLDRDPPDGREVYIFEVLVTDGIFNTSTEVHINITDVNDNAPEFDDPDLKIEVNETTSELLIQLEANDVDAGENGLVTYYVESPNTGDISINNITGLLTVSGPFDREIEAEIDIVVVAEDNGDPRLSSSAMVTIIIKDENDNPPMFDDDLSCMSAEIFENTGLGTLVCAVLATDADDPDTNNAMIEYSLAGEYADLFDIIKNGMEYGEILVKDDINREVLTRNPIEIIVTAADAGEPSLNTTKTITIEVKDVNDNPPKFESTEYFVISEDALLPGDLVYSLVPADVDLPPGDIVLCKITGGSGEDLFYVNSNGTTCTIYSKTSIALNPDNFFVVMITAYNPDNDILTSDESTTQLTIYVGISFCIIRLNPDEYRVILRESDVVLGEPVVQVNVTSSCGVVDTKDIIFNITEQNYLTDPESSPTPSDSFDIDDTGVVSAVIINPATGIHRMNIEVYNTSAENPDQTKDTGTIEIIITPNNNSAPEFDADMYSQILQVPKAAGYDVFDLGDRASDPDEPRPGVGDLVFSKIAETSDGGDGKESFDVTADGQIMLIRDLALEDIDVGYTVNISVRVEDQAVEPLTDFAYVLVAITLPYATPPMFTNSTCEADTISIYENVPIGSEICTVKAEGPSSITYGLTGETNFEFEIDSNTGRVTTKREFDYDKPMEDRQFAVVVYAESAGQRAYKTLEVTILDINDNRPMFQEDMYMFSIEEDSEDSNCKKIVGVVQATDSDGFPNNAAIKYELIGENYNFTIDSDDGVISTTVCVDREDPLYMGGTVTLTVLAINNAGDANLNDTASVVITIEDINDNAPVFDRNEYTETLGILVPYSNLLTVRAVDDDQGDNNGAVYYILAQDQSSRVYEYFKVDKTTGDVTTKNTTGLEEEEYFEITFKVEAWDKGSPPMMGMATINVLVSSNHLNEPIFPDDIRLQKLEIDENVDPNVEEGCIKFAAPEYPNNTLPIYSIVGNSSGEFEITCPQKAEICLTRALDREDTDQYILTVEATLCNITDCPPDECSPVVAHVERTQGYNVLQNRNQAVLEINVGDVNDYPPKIPTETWPDKYGFIVAVADDATFNTRVLQSKVEDKDIDSQLEYTFELNASDEYCKSRKDAFAIEANGSTFHIFVQEALYKFLEIPEGNDDFLTREMSACDYVIRVMDTATEEGEASAQVTAKIKILYVFEHIIARFQIPLQEIVVDDIERCMSDGVSNEYVVAVEYIRPHVIEDKNNQQSVIDPDSTDVWMYAVESTTGNVVKSWDIESKLDTSFCPKLLYINGTKPFDYIPVSPQYIVFLGYIFMLLGGIIALAALLCICILFESWDRMQLEKGKHIASEIDTWSTQDEGAVDLSYDAESISDQQTIATKSVANGNVPLCVETAAGTEYEWVEPNIQTSWLANNRLFESQELTMDIFYDSDVDPDALPLAVPTLATIMVEHEVDRQEDGDDYDQNNGDDEQMEDQDQDNVGEQEQDENQDHGDNESMQEDQQSSDVQDKDQQQGDQDQEQDNVSNLQYPSDTLAAAVKIYDVDEFQPEQPIENDSTNSDQKTGPTESDSEKNDDDKLVMSQDPDGRFIPIVFNDDDDDEEDKERADAEDGTPRSLPSPHPLPPPPPPPPPPAIEQDQESDQAQNKPIGIPLPGLTEFPTTPADVEEAESEPQPNQPERGLIEFPPPPPDSNETHEQLQPNRPEQGLAEFPLPPSPPPADIIWEDNDNMGQLTVFPVDDDPTLDIHNQYF